jgi:glutathione S-transferase
VKTYGWGVLPKAFNNSPGRREVERLTGNRWVPVLVTDDGETVQGSREIMDWARAHPAVASSAAT